MSRFSNQKTKRGRQTTVRKYKYGINPISELSAIMMTSFGDSEFYRSFNDTTSRVDELISLCNPKQVASEAIRIRNDVGMRTMPQVVMAKLADHLSGISGAKQFYSDFVRTPADIVEIMAFRQLTVTGKPRKVFPNAMTKGFKSALEEMDGYQIAKYGSKKGSMTLTDAIRITHAYSPVIAEFMNGNLKPANTWEVRLSAAGSDAKKKYDVWNDLVANRKLGFQATIRNLRNIRNQSSSGVFDKALRNLEQEGWLEKSGVLPYQIFKSIEVMREECNWEAVRVLERLLNRSMSNLPDWKGNTMLILDTSYSMVSERHSRWTPTAGELASDLGSLIVKRYDADVIEFSTNARRVSVNPNDSLLTLRDNLKRNFSGGGTNLANALELTYQFQRVKPLERVVILTDNFANYGRFPQDVLDKFPAKTKVYLWNLATYGKTALHGRNVWYLSGFSPQAFDSVVAVDSILDEAA